MAKKAQPELFSIQYERTYEPTKEHFVGTARTVEYDRKRYTKHFALTETAKSDAAFMQDFGALLNEEGRVSKRGEAELSDWKKIELMEDWVKKGYAQFQNPENANGFKRPGVVGEALVGREWHVCEEYSYENGINRDVVQPDGSMLFGERDYFVGTTIPKMEKSNDANGAPDRIAYNYDSGETKLIENFSVVEEDGKRQSIHTVERFSDARDGIVKKESARHVHVVPTERQKPKPQAA